MKKQQGLRYDCYKIIGQQTIMGGLNEPASENKQQNVAQLLENLQLYEETQSDQLGPIKIYKQTQKPYKYIMLYTENGIDDRTTMLKMEEKFKWYKSLKPHPHIVDIEGLRLVQKSEMCIKKLSLQIYTRYYNHNLQMAIHRKLKRNKRFKEADFFYVLTSLLNIWKHINQYLTNKYVQLFNIKNAYLSPEGYVKVYPFPIDIDFVSSPLKPKRTHSYTQSLLLNEEFHMEMSLKRTQPNTNTSSPVKPIKQLTQTDNLRDIGLIIFQLVLLNKDGEQILQFPLEKQTQLLQHLQDQHYISKHLKEILIILLSRYRDTTYEELMAMIDLYKGDMDKPISTTIKLEDGPEFVEPKEIEKTYNLKRLSEHKNLKTGIISIMSKKKVQSQL